MKRLNEKDGKLWKQYRLHCNHCGSDQWIPFWLLKLRFIFSNRFHYHCPVCHKQSTFIFQFNTVHDTMDKSEKLFNKSEIWERRLLR